MLNLIMSMSLLLAIHTPTDPEQIIKSKLHEQTQCWNKGDLECFMQAYWKSDSLKFIGGSGITYGWQQTLKKYKAGYPSDKERGILAFHILTMEAIESTAYFVVGKYHLSREIGDDTGYFSLLWKKIDNDWVIVADHSSH